MPVKAQPISSSRYVIYALDVTGSYAFAETSARQAGDAVQRHAQPGDVWFLRKIDDRSYSDRASIMTLHCPPLPPTTSNPFAAAPARARAQAQRTEFNNLKTAAADHLGKFRHSPVRGTDIYGFLAKAGELLAAAPEATHKLIVIASDMGDTCRQTASINLAHAEVVILFQSGTSPVKSQSIRDAWTKRLTNCGAASVTWRDPSEGLPTELFAN